MEPIPFIIMEDPWMYQGQGGSGFIPEGNDFIAMENTGGVDLVLQEDAVSRFILE